MSHKIYIIAAVDKKFGIGKNGKLPWTFHKDMEFFKETTLETRIEDKMNMVIMGSKTWESIPERYRPLTGRENIVLARNPEYKAKGAMVMTSIDDALKFADENIENIFFIGGGMVYKEAINHSALDGIYLTHIQKQYNCDTFFPEIPKKFSNKEILKEETEQGINLIFTLHTT